jgi:non-ribosomal peptide synthetase component F
LAWALVLAATSGQRKVVFGTVVSGRRQSNLADHVLGPFINTLPICIDVNDASLEDALLRIHSTLTELVEHQHASMTLTQHCSNVPTDTPLFNSILNFRRSNNSTMSAGSKVGIHIQDIQERTNYPFSMTVDDGTEAKLICQAPSEVDPFNLCRYMEQALTSIADSSSGVFLQDLEVLPLKERELLIETWNQTKAASNDSPCTHHVFEQQVVVSPDSVAAVHDGQSLTYNELNERANKLANHLIGLGVKPDTFVALCVERSLAIMIGILAIHKAGGAYLPLDPVYSSSRLQDIIADAGPSIVLADSLGQLTLGADALLSLAVVDPNAEYNTSAENPQVRDLTSNHLAYVIYTSGSTGRPKGVMVEHAQVVRLFDATAEWYHFNKSDIWMLTHSFSFDVSVWELWGALFHGGKLIIPSHSTIQSPEDMYSLICAQGIFLFVFSFSYSSTLSSFQGIILKLMLILFFLSLLGVTVLNLTPSAFKPIIRVHSESSLTDKLRFVILAGEALKAASLQPWYAKRSEDSPKIINMYGTTETTVHATYRVMTAEVIVYFVALSLYFAVDDSPRFLCSIHFFFCSM